MLFNALSFLVFFPYAAFVPAYLLILPVIIVLDFAAGILIERTPGSRRKAWLVFSLVGNLGMVMLRTARRTPPRRRRAADAARRIGAWGSS